MCHGIEPSENRSIVWRPPDNFSGGRHINGERIFYLAAAITYLSGRSGGRHIKYSHSILPRGTNGLIGPILYSSTSLIDLSRVYTDMRFFNARVTGAHAML